MNAGSQLEQLTIQLHKMCRPFRAWNPVDDGTQGAALGCRVMPRWGVGEERGKPLNKERRYPIALTMRGPWGCGLARVMGSPWARRIGMQGERSRVILVRIAHTASPKAIRRSLGMVPRWGGEIE